MEKKLWWITHGGESVEEKPGVEIMEKKTRGRNNGGEILELKPWRGTNEEVLAEEQSWRKTQEEAS